MGSSVTDRLRKFEELRQQLSCGLQAKERTSFSFYKDGFAVGSLVEFIGPNKTTAMALFLREHPEMKVAWVTDKLTIHPFALSQRGANLRNILFVEARDQVDWCLVQILESGCFQAVVADHDGWAERMPKTSVMRQLRRYQLLSESHHIHFFLLSQQAHDSWVPHLQLETQKMMMEAIDGPSSHLVHLFRSACL